MSKLEEELLKSPFVKTVTFGDISQVDLRKQTIFPLSHIIMNNVVQSGQVITYNMTILLNGYNRYKQSFSSRRVYWKYRRNGYFKYSAPGVGNRLVEQMRSGTLFNDMYQVSTDVTFEPFFDSFENELVGWSL